MPNEQIGAFVPTTNIWDPTEIYSTEVTSPEFKELLVRMYQNLNTMSINLNLKDTGYYDTSEFVTGQKFFPAAPPTTTLAGGAGVGTTDGAGAATGTVPGTIFEPGQRFSIGAENFRVIAYGTPGVMLTDGASTTCTYNTTTGVYVFAGAALATQIYFYPAKTSLSATVPDFRQTYRKVINFGALPNTGTTNIAHGITVDANTIFTRIYGVATDPAGLSYLPLPYASPTAANNIELSVNNTNVTIITGSNRAAYTVTYVVVEYLKF